jgi:N-acetylmuramoyl-L-alanine amidase
MVPSDITHIVIHCSASKVADKVDASVIDRWHRERGFRKIGYHFVILRDGSLQEGRKLHEPGAHALNYNTCSIGICLVGGLDNGGRAEDNFTQAQYRRLSALVRQLKGGAYAKAAVVGHRDLPDVKKDCPCFNVKQWWACVQQKEQSE